MRLSKHEVLACQAEAVGRRLEACFLGFRRVIEYTATGGGTEMKID